METNRDKLAEAMKLAEEIAAISIRKNTELPRLGFDELDRELMIFDIYVTALRHFRRVIGDNHNG